MNRFINFDLSAWRCKKSIFLLACAYLFGLITGVLFSMSASDALTSTMHAAVSGCATIFGLLSAMLLPLLFSALAVYISKPNLLFPIVFLKAFVFAYTGTGIMVSFGSAGWLIRSLLMFSDILSLPLLWLYWLNCLSHKNHWLRDTVVASTVVLLIGSVDYCVISPFLANLIS